MFKKKYHYHQNYLIIYSQLIQRNDYIIYIYIVFLDNFNDRNY